MGTVGLPPMLRPRRAGLLDSAQRSLDGVLRAGTRRFESPHACQILCIGDIGGPNRRLGVPRRTLGFAVLSSPKGASRGCLF